MKFFNHFIVYYLFIFIFTNSYGQKSSQPALRKINIKVDLKGFRLANDSLILSYHENFINPTSTQNLPSYRVEKSIISSTSFEILPKKPIGYFSLIVKDTSNHFFDETPIILLVPIESGSDIQLNLFIANNGKVFPKSIDYEVTGLGSAAVLCAQQITKGRNKLMGASGNFLKSATYEYDNNYYIDVRREASIKIVNQFKPLVSKAMFDVLMTDAKLEDESEKITAYRRKFEETSDNLLKKKLIAIYENNILNTCTDLNEFSSFSKNLPSFALARIIGNQTFKGSKINYLDLYNSIKAVIPSTFQDKVLLTFFTIHQQRISSMDSLILDSYNRITNSKDRLILDRLKSRQNGALAKDFKLPDSSGIYRSLQAYRGKVVFIDFWFTGCTPCKLYYKNVLSKVEDKFSDNSNVQFITISVDKKVETWKNSLQSSEYTSSKAVNLYTDGLGAKHLLIQDYGIKGYPSPLLIDKGGRIYTPTSLSDLREIDALSKTLEYLLKQ